jgi:hypothetical protein
MGIGGGAGIMKSKKIVQETIQTQRAAAVAQHRQTKSSMGLTTDSRSVLALISDLRGRFVGKPSLVAALQRERRKDDRAKTRKFEARDRELKAWMLKSL